MTLHQEPGRKGRTHHAAVNRRDGVALRLEGDAVDRVRRLDDLAEGSSPSPLLDDLYAGGFLTERPPALDRPVRRTPTQRMARFLSALDVHWSDADRFVRAVYRRGARLAFRPLAVAAQLLLGMAGVVALVAALGDADTIELHAAAHHVPLLLAVDLLAIAVHELAHALVVVHYGRSVGTIGFRLHLGTPAFYVDSVDALLLTRRQRLIQAAAGPWAEWLVTSVVALTLWHSPWPFVSAVLLRFVLLNTMTILSNLLPFVGLDGYLLLSDLLREPDLSHRSRGALCDLGRLLRARQLPSAEVLLLAAYAILNGLVAGVLVLISSFFWYQLFGDCLAQLASLGPLGWMAVVAVLGFLVRPAVQALTPLVAKTVTVARRMWARARFRLERRWRVRGAERLFDMPSFRHLDEKALGVLAGRLVRVRAGRQGLSASHGWGGVVAIAPGPSRRRAHAVVLPYRWVRHYQ